MKRPSHLAFIRTLSCLICGNPLQTEAAHIRYGDRRAGKPITGMGIKPDDAFVVPLCNEHHREQHSRGERQFWLRHEVTDPIFVALALYRVSGDQETAEQIIQCARH